MSSHKHFVKILMYSGPITREQAPVA